MARLPAYTNRQSLDIGSDTFRTVNDGSSRIAEGVAALGQGVFNAGMGALKQEQKQTALDERTAAKQEAEARRLAEAAQREQERFDSWNDEKEFLQFRSRVEQFAIDHREKVGEGAPNYAKDVSAYAENEYNNLLSSGRLSRTNAPRHDLMFERVRSPLVQQAANYEDGERRKFFGAISQAESDRIVANVAIRGRAGLDEAKAEWSEFVSRTEGVDTKRGQMLRQMGERRIERTALEAEAAARAPEFVSKFQGTFTNTPSATTTNPLVDATLKHASAAGFDPKVALGIGWIESRLDAGHKGPIRKDGTRMSSAEGGWQILDGVARNFGLEKADKFDPDKSTGAVMRHFADNERRLKDAGYDATPGQVYMMWNVGEGVARNILRANPNTPIEQIIYASYPSRPGFAAQVLANNPSLYKAGMTAGQVVESYERKMASAMTATAGYFGDQRPATTSEQMRAMVTEFTGVDMANVGSKDVAEIFAKVSKELVGKTKEQIEIEAGVGLLANPGRADPYDSGDRKRVNAAVQSQYGNAFIEGIGRGDSQAATLGRELTRRAGFIPEKVLHGFRTALDTGQTEPALVALTTLADISKADPRAIEATGGMPAKDKEAIKSFRAYTEVLGIPAADAAKRILFDRSPDGEAKREAFANTFKNEWRNGGSETDASSRAWKEISAKFDGSVWSSPAAATSVQESVLIDAYRQGVLHHRLQGRSLDEAKAMTLHELSSAWGTSSVADGSRSQTLMPFAPEKVLGADRAIDGSFRWVRDQAENFLRHRLGMEGKVQEAQTIYRPGGGQSELPRTATPEFQLRPASGSAANWRAGQPVEYEVWYRDQRGFVQRLVGQNFVPDYREAKAHADDMFRQRQWRADDTKAAAEKVSGELAGALLYR